VCLESVESVYKSPSVMLLVISAVECDRTLPIEYTALLSGLI
jgi:hypothetical protein